MPSRFRIKPFDNKRHARDRFDCGRAMLNNYIQHQVSADIRRTLARCYAAVHEDEPGRLAGYYTLSSYSVEAEGLPEDLEKLPYPEIPGVLIGRLASCQSFRGMGLGKALVVDALKRAVAMQDHLGIHLVVVDPLGEDVVDFYAKFGFDETENGQLILPVKTVKASMAR